LKTLFTSNLKNEMPSLLPIHILIKKNKPTHLWFMPL